MLKYVLIWVALIGLTVTTFLLSRVPTGDWSIAIALAIAAAKATLIVLFFMELAKHRGASALALGTSLVFIAVVLTLALFDVGLRFEPTRPPGPLVQTLKVGQ
ncbi:MAG: cytochrome C oxidase subunit IV family protein [Myxococcaceae bacterium]|nr:cytochrome C oxidase subunit IV family protein [Myxococcaceae bacterium]